MLRNVAKEKETTIKLAERNAGSNRWGYLIFGMMMGMLLMSMLFRILP